jgi:SAM-dependent methyltransferase
MMSGRLVEHYEGKYGHESTQVGIEPAALVQHPSGRFEAAVAFLTPRVADADVLELGAGSGTIAESVRLAGGKFSTWTLTEIAQARLDGTRRNLTDPRFRFALMDASDLQADQQFDIIVSIALIEHLVDPIEAMIGTRKMLKPGGFVYIDTPNIAKWTRRVKLALGRFPSTASADEGLATYDGKPVDLHDEGHLHYFTFRALERLLTERCGYSRVERIGYHPGGKPGPWVGNVLARRRPTLFSELCIAAYA